MKERYRVVQLLLPSGATYNTEALKWNVTVSTPVKKGNKSILLNVCGQASKGKLHAIMGPSGSGKSSLLNALAGVVPKHSLLLTGFIDSATSTEPVYIQQEDLLFAQLTVQETLETSAALREKQDIHSLESPTATVDSLILNLGLKKSKDTPVGDAKTRGLSGGEKKRLSIGNELVGCNTGSALIFADEPTSGLDSFQAERVTEILKKLADDGNTVIASIHQPRASVFALFDEITLMSEGRVMYSGETSEMAAYFSKLDYRCPNQVSPAEFYVDLISIDYSTPDQEAESKDRVTKLGDAFYESQMSNGFSAHSREFYTESLPLTITSQPRGIKGLLNNMKSAVTKFALLYRRAWRNVSRDKGLNIARLCSSLFSALLFGAIYFQLGDSAATVPDRLGLLQVAAVNTAMVSLIKATTSFVTEKLIVQRERRSGAYPVAPYFFSKLIAEAPISAVFPCLAGAIMYKLCNLNPLPGRFVRFLAILTVESFASSALGMAVGSLATSVESAIAVAPAVMVIFIVFGGLYVVNTPSYLAWVPQVSLIRWAYEALCVNEFSGLDFKPAGRVGMLAVTKGEQVLETLGYGKSTVKKALLAQGCVILANYVFTFLSLVRQKPSFEKITTKDLGDRITRTTSPPDIVASTSSSSSGSSTSGSSRNINLDPAATTTTPMKPMPKF